MQSLYRRPLPDGSIAFASADGRALFKEALSAGTLESYFALAEQHHTQADPAFCGLASLVVALNALAIDPGRLWKGPWRWFSEEQLDCCVSLAQVQAHGLTADELACLATCNGATSRLQRAETSSAETLRAVIVKSSRSGASPVLIASYSRRILGQTGSGHFSPLAGYHEEQDRVLILDVARFKYSPHWVRVEDLFRAMQDMDPVTSRSRGWIELERAPSPRNLAFVFTHRGGGWQRIATFLEHEARALLAAQRPPSADAALRVLFGAAEAAATGIALRETTDEHHRRAVESVLSELRATAPFAVARAVCTQVPPELVTALFYLLPDTTWSGLEADVAGELCRAGRVEELAEPLSSDLSVLRRQLRELQCSAVTTACQNQSCEAPSSTPIPNRDQPNVSSPVSVPLPPNSPSST
ncbi:MAG TPA: phytochelatin synthase family protein [Polyangiaceae bacterium]